MLLVICADGSAAAAGSSRRMTPTAGMPPPPKISGRGHSPATTANAKSAGGVGHDAAAGKTVATGGPRAKVPLQYPGPEPYHIQPHEQFRECCVRVRGYADCPARCQR